MSRQHRWLRGEIARWRADGLIDEALATALAERYPLVEGRAWGPIIFSAIGAGVAGLGIILFFAYNWEALPKAVKLMLVFAALIGAHGAALWSGRRDAAHLSEGLHVLGTMLFGAGIWLVAQIYHIDEHYPDGLFVWSLGALALAWALQSMVQGLLAVTLIALWVGVELFDFNWGIPWAPALVAAGVLPLAWLIRSRVLLFFGLLALLVVLMLSAAATDEELGVVVGFFTGAFFALAGFLLPRSNFPESAGACRVLGMVAYLAFLFVFSFADLDMYNDAHVGGALALAYLAVPLLLALLSGAAALLLPGAGFDGYQRGHLAGILAACVLVAALTFHVVPYLGGIAAMVFNLLFLVHSVLYVLQACRDGNVKLVSLACVMFTGLVLARYFDLFESLLVRAAVFVALGVALFVVGNVYARAKRRLTEAEA